jgi:hypothetical protein
VSCIEILDVHDDMEDGLYTIQPDSADDPTEVNCDMTTSGGGWTQFFQCLNTDACTASGQVLYNRRWMDRDYGEVSDRRSYSVGGSLSDVIEASSNFMVEITDTRNGRVGQLTYPLNDDTIRYFNSAVFYESGPLPVEIVNYDESRRWSSQRICWAPGHTLAVRTLQGLSGLSFLGITSGSPNASANSGCDYGPWNSQMLMRHPSGGALTAMWGQSPVANWSLHSFEHRIYVRGCAPAAATIETTEGARAWSDGSYAVSCEEYIRPNDTGHCYGGEVGNGLYWIDPDADGEIEAMQVQCDMTTDGGGWTPVLSWDREHDGESLGRFEELMTEEFNNMNEWIEGSNYLQWSDYALPCNDVMDWVYPIDVPNSGEVRLGLHSYHSSMEDSSVWFYVTTVDDEERNLRCWNSHGRPGGSHGAGCPWTDEEETYLPDYECGSPGSSTWTWNSTDSYDAGAEVVSFNFTGFASDGNHGDYSRIYWFNLWVR